ncbi:MAG: HPF/RaiA family ribosome-associated protein [Spirochaetales bacterium]|nr:HPF/RaiA family ribosome-associated protein [Spirochaetales bacterium]MCF7929785.1 HPF/RaiA family ribosome-associated protein [Spirochaetales bacterium]MCF7939568.1 HPF/RaiA family ribosome-associated protein [Spirochaetales bacterium]MCF7939804.1 HPF/RaiA family ribosome-associated protein [Spirochaetales bacterium]
MNLPLQISFRDIHKTQDLEDFIRSKTEKLERICDHISSCRVSVEQPQKHIKSGSPYRVRIDLTVTPAHELVSKREPGQGNIHEDLRTVIKDVFKGAENQLHSLVEKQRKEVKTHKRREVENVEPNE